MRRIVSLLLLCVGCGPAAAQLVSNLDASHLVLDGSLSDAECAEHPNTYNTFQEAAKHFGDSCTLYIRPWIYWIDNPDTPAVVTGMNGREPFGMIITAKRLHLIGLTDDANDVVLASQRGQTQGAIGNFTMFDFHVGTLVVENLTMGNYCNVDLDYPSRPELSRKKRSDAITQAHVGYVHGDTLKARNVRFISRLNLNPLNGARHSTYDNCHFECTDDAMNGTAIYRHCTIDLYGQKPFWSTFGKGAMFVDCDFYVKGQNREMYFMKQGGPLILFDCRYHAPTDSIYLGWTAYPQPWLRCYQQNFTLNGKPYVIGNHQPQNTVLLTGFQSTEPPFLSLSRHEAVLQAGRDTLCLQAGEPVSWHIESGYEQYISLFSIDDGSAVVIPAPGLNVPASFCLIATTPDGREAACHLSVKPSQLPPPTFVRQPRIKLKDGIAILDYALNLKDADDASTVVWYKTAYATDGAFETNDLIPFAVGREIGLTGGETGHVLSARIRPQSSRSEPGEECEATYPLPKVKRQQVRNPNQLDIDFSHFYCDWQPEILPGFWTVDGYKPQDTAEYPWSFNADKPMWEYKEGFNGAVGKGLLQAQRGARLMYTPVERQYGDMSLVLNVDPTKTAGQGFGSATGQYMDVCLKFNPHTLTGYGLRIIRTTKHAKAVDFLLVEYRDGKVTPISDPISATCYRTGCTISLTLKGALLSAHVETTTPHPQDSQLPHIVDLSATVQPNTYGGIHIQHTGSCGESTTMLHRLQVKWE